MPFAVTFNTIKIFPRKAQDSVSAEASSHSWQAWAGSQAGSHVVKADSQSPSLRRRNNINNFECYRVVLLCIGLGSPTCTQQVRVGWLIRALDLRLLSPVPAEARRGNKGAAKKQKNPQEMVVAD